MELDKPCDRLREWVGDDVRCRYSRTGERVIVNESIVQRLAIRDANSALETEDLEPIIGMYEVTGWYCGHSPPPEAGALVSIERGARCA